MCVYLQFRTGQEEYEVSGRHEERANCYKLIGEVIQRDDSEIHPHPRSLPEVDTAVS